MRRSIMSFISQHELVVFFVLVFICTWLHTIPELAYIWGLIATPPAPELTNALMLIMLLGGPAGAAFILTAVTGGKTGLKQWIAPLFRWRVGIGWYLLTIFSYLIIALLAFVIADLVTQGHAPSLAANMNARLSEMSVRLGMSTQDMPTVIPILILYGLVVVPLFEELGWRGYALPRLLKRYNALEASVFLGVIWAVWHLPNFFLKGTPHAGMPFGGFVLSVVSLSILMVWVYNNTNGSLLMQVLIHGSLIVASMFVSVLPLTNGGDTLPYWISVIESIVIAVVIVIVTGPQRLSRPSPGQPLSGTAV